MTGDCCVVCLCGVCSRELDWPKRQLPRFGAEVSGYLLTHGGALRPLRPLPPARVILCVLSLPQQSPEKRRERDRERERESEEGREREREREREERWRLRRRWRR